MSTPPPEDSIVNAHLSEPETPALSRYDVTLLAIPLPYLLVIPAWWFLSLPVSIALIAGSVPAIALMYEALLRRPPVTAEDTELASNDDATEIASADD